MYTNINQQKGIYVNTTVYDKQYIVNYRARKKIICDRFLDKLHLIERYKSGGKLLDIGCSIGYFLKTVTDFSPKKWNVFGTEINPLLAKEAELNTGSIISTKALPKLSYQNEQFDVVTCFDVLEHSDKIVQNLSEIKRILAKGGILVIQCPNYMSLMRLITNTKWDWWSPPDHVLHFSPKTLDMVLINAGFKVIYKRTYEYSSDYLANIRGAIFKNKIIRPIYYLLLPFLLISEKIVSALGYGGLILIIVEKR